MKKFRFENVSHTFYILTQDEVREHGIQDECKRFDNLYLYVGNIDKHDLINCFDLGIKTWDVALPQSFADQNPKIAHQYIWVYVTEQDYIGRPFEFTKLFGVLFRQLLEIAISDTLMDQHSVYHVNKIQFQA